MFGRRLVSYSIPPSPGIFFFRLFENYLGLDLNDSLESNREFSMRNSDRNLLAIGAVSVLGYVLFKALAQPSSQRQIEPRPRANPSRKPRLRVEFLPLFSMHGGEFGFGTTGNEVPEQYMTFDEAASKAADFEATADAIDGRALVLDVRNGVRYSPYKAATAQ